MAKPKDKPKHISWTDTNPNPNAVAEAAASGTEVGITASATFKHAKGPITYSLTDSAAGAFAIDPATGVVTVANGALLDYETTQSHTIAVTATDGKIIGSQSFQIGVIDVAERQEPERVSVSATGQEGNSFSGGPSLSADGRFVASPSLASNLVEGDTNGSGGIFVINTYDFLFV
jgi:large repetitive protein